MYATADDMIVRFGKAEVYALADPEDSGQLDQGVLETAISDASAEIDGYLAGRYRLPFDPTPRHLTRLCCDIARYRMTGDDRQETDPIVVRYHAAIRYLELVAAGKVTLGPAENGITPSSDNAVQFTQGERVFARRGPGAY